MRGRRGADPGLALPPEGHPLVVADLLARSRPTGAGALSAQGHRGGTGRRQAGPGAGGEQVPPPRSGESCGARAEATGPRAHEELDMSDVSDISSSPES